jgi:hypothetical protein
MGARERGYYGRVAAALQHLNVAFASDSGREFAQLVLGHVADWVQNFVRGGRRKRAS